MNISRKLERIEFVTKIIIRKATISDSHIISQLISNNAKALLQDDFEDGGLDFFLRTANNQSIKDYMEQGFIYWVALIDSNIVGVVAIKDFRHLFHLFVDKKHHKKGIAKLLWDEVFKCSLKVNEKKKFTLNSTTYALPVYERWGFLTTDKEQMRQGIRFTPMELVVKVET